MADNIKHAQYASKMYKHQQKNLGVVTCLLDVVDTSNLLFTDSTVVNL